VTHYLLLCFYPTIWWYGGYLVYSVFVCCSVCTVTDFAAAEKDSGVKLCVVVWLLSAMSFSHFGGQRSRSPGKNALSAANTHMSVCEWYALAASVMQQQRQMSAFPGSRGMTSAAACTEAR